MGGGTGKCMRERESARGNGKVGGEWGSAGKIRKGGKKGEEWERVKVLVEG